MYPDIGFFGFINIDVIAEQSLCIHDLGLELRQNEVYHYQNANRDYKGYLFQYTLEGYGIYETPGTSYRMSKGKAFFITFPDDSRYYLPTEQSESSWKYFYIHFSGPAAEPFFRRIRELTGPMVTLELESPAIRLFFELYEVLKSGIQLERYRGSEWLYRFLTTLLRSIEFPADKKSSPHVTAAASWMQLNYAGALSLEAMSKEIGVSFSHLSRQFYKEKGLTPIQYLTQIRLEHAMQLLLGTDLTIQKIAEECGFSCGNYFSKVYKKVLHLTPEEYRKQHKV
ncbi:MAG TPA: AraC family transcriptional regulator [Mobilitalea sp.]|nr:AraC family transcriptional regulator [Mobilitalea sp.]